MKGFKGRNTNEHAEKKINFVREMASRWGDDELGCWKILSFGCKTAVGDFP